MKTQLGTPPQKMALPATSSGPQGRAVVGPVGVASVWPVSISAVLKETPFLVCFAIFSTNLHISKKTLVNKSNPWPTISSPRIWNRRRTHSDQWPDLVTTHVPSHSSSRPLEGFGEKWEAILNKWEITLVEQCWTCHLKSGGNGRKGTQSQVWNERFQISVTATSESPVSLSILKNPTNCPPCSLWYHPWRGAYLKLRRCFTPSVSERKSLWVAVIQICVVSDHTTNTQASIWHSPSVNTQEILNK